MKNMGRFGLSIADQKVKRSVAKSVLIPEFEKKWLSYGQLRGKPKLVKGDVMALRSRLLSEGKADSTVAKYLLVGSTAINKAEEYQEWVLPNPFKGTCRGLEAEVREREITKDEETKILFRFIYKEILIVMVECGMRRGELDTLKRDQVYRDSDGWWIKLRFKSNKWRKVALSPLALRTIQKQPKRSDYVFTNKKGESVKYQTFIKAFHRAREKAKVDHCTPHDFRRTFGYRKRRGGAELDDLQAQYGHASRSTTERVYAKVDERKSQNAVLACGKAL